MFKYYMNNPNSFNINASDVLFFNIFIKNNLLYCITPLYKNNIMDHNEMIIECNNCNLSVKETVRKEEYEATQIIIYDLSFSIQNTYDICVTYKDKKKNYTLTNIVYEEPKQLCLTTLLKTDYKLIDMFYKYYKKQGVDHFYMYYNGLLNDEIKSYYNKPDITMIEWNFKYWNTKSIGSNHHAQLGQIHDALYRFGKDNTKYMIFCDLDEYMYNKEHKLIDLIKNDSYDTFLFLNRFSNFFTKDVPNEFPTEFKVASPLPFPQRCKCIHKVDSIKHLGIHKGTKYNKKSNIDKSSIHFHFHTLGGGDVTPFSTPDIIKIELP